MLKCVVKQKLKTMSEKEFDFHVDNKISQLMKAVADYQNNPDKAKDYIFTTVKNIVKASKEFGETSVTNELFG